MKMSDQKKCTHKRFEHHREAPGHYIEFDRHTGKVYGVRIYNKCLNCGFEEGQGKNGEFSVLKGEPAETIDNVWFLLTELSV